MLTTMGQTFQQMLAGRMSPQDVVKKIQKDWEDYHKELAG
jgi:ABC-type glycerol-3-phosphate transport system substrate-binding protein